MKRLALLPIALLATVPVTPGMAAGLSVLGAMGNASVVIQNGKNNTAAVSVSGANNLTTVVQLGDGHSYTYSNTGDNRGLSVVQESAGALNRTYSLSAGNSVVGSKYVIEVTPKAAPAPDPAPSD